MDKYELVEYSGLERPEYILKNGKALNIYGAKKIIEQQQQEIAELKAELDQHDDQITNIEEANRLISDVANDKILELMAMVNEFIEEFSCFVAQHECNCGHPSCRTCKECKDAFKLLDKAGDYLNDKK